MVDVMDDDRNKSPLSIKDLIPGSRLAALVGDSLYASEPMVCEGDDAYEVNLTTEVDGDHRLNRQTVIGRAEEWMSPDTEHKFLEYIMGGDATEVDDLISYVEKNLWFGGKQVCLSLDVGKTISNRSTKLVLNNSSGFKSTLSYYVPNSLKPLKKTDFILEDWPHVSVNQPLIPNGNENEFPPWIRQRNKEFNTQVTSIGEPVLTAPIDQQQVSQLQEQQLYQPQYQQPNQYQYQQYQYQQLQEQQVQHQQQLQQQILQLQQQQQYQYQQQQYHQQQQHLQYQYHKQQQQQYQQYQYQQQSQQQQPQPQQQQRNNIFISSSLPHQVLMFGRPPYLGNFQHLQLCPGDNYHQRFSTPLLLPTHCYWNAINTNSRPATVQQ